MRIGVEQALANSGPLSEGELTRLHKLLGAVKPLFPLENES